MASKKVLRARARSKAPLAAQAPSPPAWRAPALSHFCARAEKAKASTIVRVCRCIEGSEKLGYGSNLAGVAFLMKRKHVIDVVREMKWARKGLLDLGARLAQLLALLKNFEDEKHRLDRATALADDISLALSGVRDSAEHLVACPLLNAGPAALALGPVCVHAAAMWCEDLENATATTVPRFIAAVTTRLKAGALLRHAPHAKLVLGDATVRLAAELAAAQVGELADQRRGQQGQFGRGRRLIEENQARERDMGGEHDDDGRGVFSPVSAMADDGAKGGDATTDVDVAAAEAEDDLGDDLGENANTLPWHAFRAWLLKAKAAAREATKEANRRGVGLRGAGRTYLQKVASAREEEVIVPQPLVGPFRARLIACVSQANPIFGALRDLFLCTAGPRWVCNTGWLRGEAFGRWFGVQVHRPSGVVVTLSLSSNNLRGQIPPSIAALSELVDLDLSQNRLRGIVPATVGQLSKLRLLRLNSKPFCRDQNRLSGALPPEIGQCTALRVLDVSVNRIRGPLPADLGNCKALQQLMLHDNEVDDIIPAALGKLNALRLLRVDENRLVGCIPQEIGEGCETLEYLDLSVNRLTGALPATLGRLQHLVHLDARYNQLSGALPPEIADASQMLRLTLGSNRLEGTLPATLGKLKKLQVLMLEHNCIEGVPPVELSNCGSLEVLNLSCNRLRGELPMAFGRLNTLRELWLHGNVALRDAPHFRQHMQRQLDGRCNVYVDSDRWILAHNPGFDLRRARLRPSPDNTETMVVRVEPAVDDLETDQGCESGALEAGKDRASQALRAAAAASGSRVLVRRFVEDARVPPKHYVEFVTGTDGDQDGDTELQPTASSAAPPSLQVLDMRHAIRLLRRVEWVEKIKCWRVDDKLPAGILEEEEAAAAAKNKMSRMPAVEWLARRPLAPPKDDGGVAAFQAALGFDEDVGAAAATGLARCSNAGDVPEHRIFIDDGGLELATSDGVGDAAVAVSQPLPMKGEHSVAMRVTRATETMAIGVVSSLANLPASTDCQGWLGSAQPKSGTSLCYSNASGALRKSGKTVAHARAGAIADNSLVVVMHKLGQVTIEIDGEQHVMRGAQPPMHVCVSDGPDGGLELRLLRGGAAGQAAASSSDDESGASDEGESGGEASSNGDNASEEEYDDDYSHGETDEDIMHSDYEGSYSDSEVDWAAEDSYSYF